MRAFQAIASQGVLERNCLEQLLTRMGHREVCLGLIEALVKGVTLSWHLDAEDAVNLAVLYRARYQEKLDGILGKGLVRQEPEAKATVDASASDMLFSSLHTLVAPGVKTQLKHTLGLQHGDRCYTQIATAEELMRMRDLIIDHSGFTPKEHKRVKATFARYDHDNSGHLIPKDMRLALTWLGATPAFAREATDDLCGQGVTEEAFVEQVIAFFRHEERRIRDAMDEVDNDRNGLLDCQELTIFFERLGFVVANPEVLKEALADCGLDSNPSLSYEDIYQVFMRFREASGFTKAELAEVVEAFDNFDKDESSGLSAAELEIAVQWLGYPTQFETVRRFLQENDIDDSGEIELDEFAGFVAKYRDVHFNKIRAWFDKFAAPDDTGQPVFPAESMHGLLLGIGYVIARPACDRLVAPAGSRISFWSLVALVAEVRIEAREKCRRNHCFTDAQVRRLRGQFDKRADGSGCIRGRKLACMMEELYPGIRESVEMHARARRMIEAADNNGDMCLDFKEFLCFMRTFQFERRLEELRKEREALAQTSFTARERIEFRKVFDMFDEDASGDIDIEELSTMLDGVVPPECLNRNVLDRLREASGDGSRALTFADFLVFMQELAHSTAGSELKRFSAQAEESW